jgi:hypothetical protein
VDSDAANVVVANFNLTRVDTGPDFDAERLNRVTNRAGTPDRACWPVERRKHTITGLFHHDAAVSSHFLCDEFVVRVENGSPCLIAQRSRSLCRGTLGRCPDCANTPRPSRELGR